jgi:peptidoglycan/xylan/chitin deacetylase (PgdA/CDA1 family)
MSLFLSGIYKPILYQLRLLIGTHNMNQLVILMYHGVIRSPLKVYDWCFVDEASFHSQMKYLKRHFEVISLSESVERLRNGKIQQPTAVITFDDGFHNNYDIAFPILRQAKLPATIFLVTGLVNTNNTIWFCYLNRSLAESQKTYLDWDGNRFNLSSPATKAMTSSTIQKKLKKFPHPKLQIELRKIVLELGDDRDRPIEIGSAFRMLSHEAISEMATSGLIEFGAHTHSHAILSLLSAKERYDEIERSVTAINKLTGHPCVLFAYPNGRNEDYNAETIEILKACGVRASVTAIEGTNNGMTPLMELRRYGVGGDLSLEKFKQEVRKK